MAEHRSGYVNIIGSPNVGKSTLMNVLVGERLSIITNKAQTTRHRIHGIVNTDDYQIVFSDTPGILDPAYKLHEGMMNFVFTALQDADILVVMTEVGEKQFKNESILKKVSHLDVPILVVINKMDLADSELLNQRVSEWEERLPNAIILPISALLKVNTDQVLKQILSKLPESPPYFPKDELSDRPMRFFVSEIIREKIFLNYTKEIPYSCEVVVESYKDEPKIIRIRAEIYVARDSQKGIIIGHKGAALKKTGTMAREDMEVFLGKKVFLEVHVKVAKDWRNHDRELKRFGYLN